jgi:nucleoside-diphosphate-sugar epimerase
MQIQVSMQNTCNSIAKNFGLIKNIMIGLIPLITTYILITKIHNDNFSKFSRKVKLKLKKIRYIKKYGIRLNNSKLKKLGWRLTTGISEGIKKTINFHL